MTDDLKARETYHHGDLRRALLKAAEDELAEKGPEGFTLRGCAKRAGVSHAAPAHHFGDTTGLLSALAGEGYQRFHAAIEARMDASPDQTPEGRMVAAGLGYVAFARANPALFGLMFSSRKPDYGNPALEKAASAAFDQLVDSVAAFHGDDPLSSRKGRQQVAAIWSVVHGLSDLLLSQRLKLLAQQGDDELEQDLTGILRALISPKEA
ncbi:TetR/AcrR family transcriptional regulator [Mesorhizobium sp. CAU 1732]|uniref:TetR/AcrR family transcriptional regulator n=1 Tax=Mesorhizobium sp. CAU 1732 TaxID=3140358 RepID=UPI003260541B